MNKKEQRDTIIREVRRLRQRVKDLDQTSSVGEKLAWTARTLDDALNLLCLLAELVDGCGVLADPSDEMVLRQQQLTEIRRMLRLPESASHQAVCTKLAQIGEHDSRIDVGALPEQYRR